MSSQYKKDILDFSNMRQNLRFMLYVILINKRSELCFRVWYFKSFSSLLLFFILCVVVVGLSNLLLVLLAWWLNANGMTCKCLYLNMSKMKQICPWEMHIMHLSWYTYTSFTIMFHWNSFHLLESNFCVVISVEFLVFVFGCAKIVLVHLLIDVKFSSNTLLGELRNMTLFWLKRTYDKVKVPQYVNVH